VWISITENNQQVLIAEEYKTQIEQMDEIIKIEPLSESEEKEYKALQLNLVMH
jgi:hypothetical protein